MKTLSPWLISALASLWANAAGAQTTPPPDRAALEAELSARFDAIADRLQLTPDQRERAEPIVRASLSRRIAALINARADGSFDAQERQSLRSQFETERRGVAVELDAFLSDAQMADLRRIQREELADLRAELARRIQ